jgi:hypothetical protein
VWPRRNGPSIIATRSYGPDESRPFWREMV